MPLESMKRSKLREVTIPRNCLSTSQCPLDKRLGEVGDTWHWDFENRPDRKEIVDELVWFSGLLELLACILSFSSHPLGGALRNCKIGVGINIPISEVFKRSEIDILFESFEAVIASNVLGCSRYRIVGLYLGLCP